MKSWQDRGEVLDSDDEDLSLGADSQSPDRPRKKQRVSGSGGYPRDDGTAPKPLGSGAVYQEENDDEDWLQPQVTTTYGRKTKTSKSVNVEYTTGAPTWRDTDGDTATLAASNPSQRSQTVDFPDINDEREISKYL